MSARKIGPVVDFVKRSAMLSAVGTRSINVAENDTFGVEPALVPRKCSDAPPSYRQPKADVPAGVWPTRAT
eukprot:COSAG01_NODE_2827_length_7003_cov_127.679316_2_plen_71_part_00